MKLSLQKIILVVCGVIVLLYALNQMLLSGDFMEGELKKLDLKSINNDDIEILWYYTSSVTTIHEHVEVSKAGKTHKIAELNQGGIQKIHIDQDTIYIETNGNGLFYSLEPKIFDYTIVLDTLK